MVADGGQQVKKLRLALLTFGGPSPPSAKAAGVRVKCDVPCARKSAKYSWISFTTSNSSTLAISSIWPFVNVFEKSIPISSTTGGRVSAVVLYDAQSQ